MNFILNCFLTEILAGNFNSIKTTPTPPLQSIGFVGPAIALLGLNAARSPLAASAWLTTAVGLSSFSHSGFLVNLQVSRLWIKLMR